MIKKQDTVFVKTSNHIYEVCESFAVMGISKRPRGSSVILELCREIVEIKEGKINSDNEDETQLTRLNFATISMSPACAERLMKSLEHTLSGLAKRKEEDELPSEQE